MGFLFPKAPAANAPPAYQPPAPAPAPEAPPTPASPAVVNAAVMAQRSARQAASGGKPGASMGGTLLTGPGGAPDSKTAKSTLGGG